MITRYEIDRQQGSLLQARNRPGSFEVNNDLVPPSEATFAQTITAFAKRNPYLAFVLVAGLAATGVGVYTATHPGVAHAGDLGQPHLDNTPTPQPHQIIGPTSNRGHVGVRSTSNEGQVFVDPSVVDTAMQTVSKGSTRIFTETVVIAGDIEIWNSANEPENGKVVLSDCAAEQSCIDGSGTVAILRPGPNGIEVSAPHGDAGFLTDGDRGPETFADVVCQMFQDGCGPDGCNKVDVYEVSQKEGDPDRENQVNIANSRGKPLVLFGSWWGPQYDPSQLGIRVKAIVDACVKPENTPTPTNTATPTETATATGTPTPTRENTVTPTPTPTGTRFFIGFMPFISNEIPPTPTRTPTPTPTPTETPTPTATPDTRFQCPPGGNTQVYLNNQWYRFNDPNRPPVPQNVQLLFKIVPEEDNTELPGQIISEGLSTFGQTIALRQDGNTVTQYQNVDGNQLLTLQTTDQDGDGLPELQSATARTGPWEPADTLKQLFNLRTRGSNGNIQEQLCTSDEIHVDPPSRN